MDQYKQNLCLEHFGKECNSEENILRCIAKNEEYSYNLNADGKLHSRYSEEFGCYEPAIIRRGSYTTTLYWLFDGEIKDCLHPFMVRINREYNRIYAIGYYSLEQIQRIQPILIVYNSDHYCSFVLFNKFIGNGVCFSIISDIDSNICTLYNKFDMSQFVTIAPGIICPLWSDEFAGNDGLFKFKFED